MLSKRTSACLALTAGYVDTATFIAISGLFSAHVTGNFIVFAGALARGVREVDYLKLAVFPVFIISVSLATFLYEKWKSESEPLAGHRLLWAKLLLLIIAVVLVVCTHGFRPSPTITFWDGTAALILTFAMGLQNAFHKLHSASTPATTMMTGNVSTLTVELTRRYLLKTKVKSTVDISSVLVVTSTFLVGCIAAGFLTSYFGLGSVLVPALILGALLLLGGRDVSKG